MKFSAIIEETDEFGQPSERAEEWNPPLVRGDKCFVLVVGKFGQYVQEVKVRHVMYDTEWGWEMTNDWQYAAKEYGESVFPHDALDAAKQACAAANSLDKVRVKRLK